MATSSLLRWAIENSDPATLRAMAADVERAGANGAPPPGLSLDGVRVRDAPGADPGDADPASFERSTLAGVDRQKWLAENREVLDEFLRSDAERMRDALKTAYNAAAALDDRLAAMDQLLDLVESLDNANDVPKLRIPVGPEDSIGGLDAIMQLLRTENDTELRAAAAWVLGTCAQNNPPFQAVMLRRAVFVPLLEMLLDEREPAAVRSKLVHCLSGFMQANVENVRAMHQWRNRELREAAASWNGVDVSGASPNGTAAPAAVTTTASATTTTTTTTTTAAAAAAPLLLGAPPSLSGIPPSLPVGSTNGTTATHATSTAPSATITPATTASANPIATASSSSTATPGPSCGLLALFTLLSGNADLNMRRRLAHTLNNVCITEPTLLADVVAENAATVVATLVHCLARDCDADLLEKLATLLQTLLGLRADVVARCARAGLPAALTQAVERLRVAAADDEALVPACEALQQVRALLPQ